MSPSTIADLRAAAQAAIDHPSAVEVSVSPWSLINVLDRLAAKERAASGLLSDLGAVAEAVHGSPALQRIGAELLADTGQSVMLAEVVAEAGRRLDAIA